MAGEVWTFTGEVVVKHAQKELRLVHFEVDDEVSQAGMTPSVHAVHFNVPLAKRDDLSDGDVVEITVRRVS